MTLNFDRWVGKVAIVTGASAGIGAAVAERLVIEGLKVVGLARREERVEELAKKLSNEKGKLYALKTDLTKEDEILKSFEWVKENLGPIHILINNAGVANFTESLMSGKTEEWQKVLQVNVIALSICTREAIQDMKANNVDGHIIHVNSLSGHRVFDGHPSKFNVYPASKFAVTALTETLRHELNAEKSKIKITSISPGGVASEFAEVAKIDENFFKTMTESYDSGEVHILKPEDIAESIYYALATPPHVQIHDILIRPVGQKN